MKPVITAFRDSPDGGEGMARDMRVRWALAETGRDYDVRLVTFNELKQPEHLARQPFGSIPTYEEGELTLFESGAIILHLGTGSPALLPVDPDARARAVTWLIAALNTVEPPIVELEAGELLGAKKPWWPERRRDIEERVRDRLTRLSARLGEADWLDGQFTAGDLMMVEVLRRLDGTGIVEEYANLASYIARAKARPAWQRAYAAQRAVWQASQRAS